MKSEGQDGTIDWKRLAVRPTRVTDTLSARLQQLIAEQAFRPSQRLPSERELSVLLGVSRASVREAIHELVLKGLVDRRPGRGTVVLEPGSVSEGDGLLGILDAPSRELLAVLDFRETIEPPIAALAARRATPSEKMRLEEIVLSMTESISSQRSLELDLEFHRQVALAGHNPLLVRLVDVTFDWIELGRHSAHATARGRMLSTEGHRDILETIVRGDPGEASTAMLRHIRSVGDVARAITQGEQD